MNAHATDLLRTSKDGTPVLPYRVDRYGGVDIDERSLCAALGLRPTSADGDASGSDGDDDDADHGAQPTLVIDSPDAFVALLTRSLDRWAADGRRGVWLKLPAAASELVPLAVRGGHMRYHHATPAHLMLTRWLPDQAATGRAEDEDRLPPGPSHHVGVAGFVLNALGELLVVQEKTGPLRGLGVWKLPGGLADPGEDIAQAAVREVREETGVAAEFVALSSVMEFHGGPSGRRGPSRLASSDLYCTCVCAAARADDEVDGRPVLRPQAAEIEAAAWMTIDDFLATPRYAKEKSGSAFRTMLESAVAIATRRGLIEPAAGAAASASGGEGEGKGRRFAGGLDHALLPLSFGGASLGQMSVLFAAAGGDSPVPPPKSKL